MTSTPYRVSSGFLSVCGTESSGTHPPFCFPSSLKCDAVTATAHHRHTPHETPASHPSTHGTKHPDSAAPHSRRPTGVSMVVVMMMMMMMMVMMMMVMIMMMVMMLMSHE
jgi:hypothetical protein